MHKHPNRLQSFELSFSKAHVFDPEASLESCTAGNDCPYVASALLSLAIAQVFGSALAGRSKDKPELLETAIPLTAKLAVVPKATLSPKAFLNKYYIHNLLSPQQGFQSQLDVLTRVCFCSTAHFTPTHNPKQN